METAAGDELGPWERVMLGEQRKAALAKLLLRQTEDGKPPWRTIRTHDAKHPSSGRRYLSRGRPEVMKLR
jgi:hypothetical protein